MKKKYKIHSWKFSTEGEFENEKEAIKSLSDSYLKASKCDPPGEHPVELLNGVKNRDITKIGKSVALSVFEKNKYGIEEWIQAKHLTIHPFKKEHWWDSETFKFKECDFKYTEV